MMRRLLRILSLEDDPRDAELIHGLLEAEGIACEVTRVDTQPAFEAALEGECFDLILADYTLPSFDGLSALNLAMNACPDVPFLFVTGTLGEEVAIEALKVGATDYVLKTSLSRLAPSILRALREANDRAERKRAEQALRRNEAYLSQAQTLSHTGSFGWNVSSGDIYWSEETFRIFEYEPAVKPTLQLIFQRTHPDDRDHVEQTIDRVVATRGNFDLEHRLLMPDGSIKYLHVLARALETSPGNLEFVGAVTDVTERNRAEEALRASENNLRRIVDSVPGLLCAMSPDGKIELANRPLLEFFGKTNEELNRWSTTDVVHPDDLQRVVDAFRSSMANGTPFDDELRYCRADGVYRWFQVNVDPVRDADGRITGWYGLITDIEDRKQAEDNLRQSENELRHILDFAPQQVAVLGPDRSRIYANRAMLDYLGFSLEEWHSGDPRRFVHPDDFERMMRNDHNKFLSGLPYEVETRLLGTDEKYRWFLFRYSPLRDEQGRITRWYLAGTDIEDRKQAEQRLQNENVALREEIDRASMFEEIVGTSPALRAVLSRVSKVGPTDSTVLITGETGTGKELIARAVHKRSQRSSRAFVSVNCAAIPRDLIASELFGHEKGAFTGAVQRRLGRFELAEGGTIFLDEIGDLPTETQVALLRVLQEREFERVGGTGSIRTNVRLIAATNRDLQTAIAAGTFRSDLFYRLNVFPIEVPPLRERWEDIPVLVAYFIDRYAGKTGKSIRSVNKQSLELLQSYPWPGNIRELQNVIERSVIVCDTENFFVDESWLSHQPPRCGPKSQPELSRMMADEEKEMIEAALRESGGRVSGPAGAAVKLGIPGSTLDSKIRSLKIDKNRFKSPYPSTDHN
jgi:formate hydrogenlyase transcriptional activator